MTLTVKNLTVRYGKNVVLNDFNYIFSDGITCILGPSGCGKTTLLRTLMGLVIPDSGYIISDPPNLKRSVLFQENRLIENMSAVSNIRFVCPHCTKAQMIQALSDAGLGTSLNLPVKDLSGGMQRRVAFVRALLAEFDWLFLDEPFTGLDDKTQADMLPLLRSIGRRPVLLVTHDETLADKLGARVVRLG